MEGTLNYKEKCWTESLDTINNNLIKMYSTQREFERTLNSIGQRQTELIKQLALNMEWSVLNRSREDNRSRQTKVQILEFSPSAAGYKLDIVIYLPPIGIKEEENNLPSSSISFPSLYLISYR